MAQIFNATLQGLMPSQDSPPYATPNPVNLPYGGPYGTTSGGGAYPQAANLICVAGTIQSEVITVAIAGSTGTLVFTFFGDTIYQAQWLVGDTLAIAQTALEGIFGAGNVTVTGTAGTTYTITMSGALANQRIGGYITVAATTAGTPTVTRSTRGSSGAGQYDLYAGSGQVKGFLQYKTFITPQGFIGTPDIGFSTEQPQSPSAWTRGRYFVSDLITTGANALDATAMTAGNMTFIRGTALADVGAEIEIL